MIMLVVNKVKQSWFTTIFSTLYAVLQSIQVIYTYRPTVICCNGPGILYIVLCMCCAWHGIFKLSA